MSNVSDMDEHEIALSGAPYKAEVTRLFRFLVDEFGFEAPADIGGAYRHTLVYKHPKKDLAVVLANAFHPVDYGFEITIYPAEGPWRGDPRHIVFHALKEDQERDFRFLADGASALRKALIDVAVAHHSFAPKPMGDAT